MCGPAWIGKYSDGVAIGAVGGSVALMSVQRISGRIVDLHRRVEYPGTVEVAGGRIRRIVRDARLRGAGLIMPGLVDAHIHIESSLLPPAEFARLAVVHGTVATVSDPHEIANVLGVAGVDAMIRDGRRTPSLVRLTLDVDGNVSFPTLVAPLRIDPSASRNGFSAFGRLPRGQVIR